MKGWSMVGGSPDRLEPYQALPQNSRSAHDAPSPIPASPSGQGRDNGQSSLCLGDAHLPWASLAPHRLCLRGHASIESNPVGGWEGP